MDEYLEAMQDDMNAALEALGQSLTKVRTGRATPKLLDGVQVMVQSYGTSMPLNQLATVQAPDARLLTITPWDKTTITDIERGVVSAGLGLNPSNDGQIIRVPVPALTQDRRKELVKQVRKSAEEHKVGVREARRVGGRTRRRHRDGRCGDPLGAGGRRGHAAHGGRRLLRGAGRGHAVAGAGGPLRGPGGRRPQGCGTNARWRRVEDSGRRLGRSSRPEGAPAPRHPRHPRAWRARRTLGPRSITLCAGACPPSNAPPPNQSRPAVDHARNHGSRIPS